MSFEYRELTTQVFLNATDAEESPCRQVSCRQTDEDDDNCVICATTGKPCQTGTCNEDPDEKDYEGEGLKTLALLRQQLRDNLAAG